MPGMDSFTAIAPLIFIFAIMYFLLIRPQQQRMKQHREMVANVRRGDTVVTAGGIVGKVLRVYPSTSLVLMINDQSSGVGALLEKSRLQGVLRGTPTGELILERVMV